MTDKHPITPPPELVELWTTGAYAITERGPEILFEVALQAALWGADQQLKLDAEQIAQAYQKGANQELEACCAWLKGYSYSGMVTELRVARRPKPPSLKEQAQAELDRLIALIPAEGAMAMAEPIRRALEALPND